MNYNQPYRQMTANNSQFFKSAAPVPHPAQFNFGIGLFLTDIYESLLLLFEIVDLFSNI